MTKPPLMPMATALWLVENTTLTFKQIAEFCKMHEVEVQGIADGEVGKGIVAYNPIMSGQLTRDEIELSSKDNNRSLKMKNDDVDIEFSEKKINIKPLTKNRNKIKTSDILMSGKINFPIKAKTTLTSIEKMVRLSIFLNGKTRIFLKLLNSFPHL